MKKIWFLMICSSALMVISGCGGRANDNKDVEVIVEGGGQFPAFLAGKWRSDKLGWEFTFEPNGVISSAIFSLGQEPMRPGQITRVPMKMNGEGVFEPGKWLVDYDPNTRELTVQVSLKRFRAQLGDGVLEGKSTDIFVGPVSENGKAWQVVWTSFGDYTVHTKQNPNAKLATDPNGEVTVLVFTKAEEGK